MALLLECGCRLRAAARGSALLSCLVGETFLGPSYFSVRLWLLRVGLYQLGHAKEQADDWIWIMDHTMQLGEWKCLIVVGLRQAAWDARDRCLRHEDVELIDLEPVSESTGEVVYRQMEAATAKTGVPRMVVSDDGRDLHRGIALFVRPTRPRLGCMTSSIRRPACCSTIWKRMFRGKSLSGR